MSLLEQIRAEFWITAATRWGMLSDTEKLKTFKIENAIIDKFTDKWQCRKCKNYRWHPAGGYCGSISKWVESEFGCIKFEEK